MAFTLRQLEIFLAVAETCHVTKASKKVNLTQSAVSMAIAELENQLGSPLFDRQGRKLILNDRGRFLMTHANDILCHAQRVEALLTEQEDAVAGILNIGASSTIGNYLLPYLIGAFAQLYPNVSVQLIVGNTEQVEENILEGKMDLGFIEGFAHSNKIDIIPWLMDELTVIIGPSHYLAQKDELTIEDVEEAKWIMREEGSGTAEIFKSKIQSAVTHLNVILQLGNTEAIKKAVESGLGISCISYLAASREIEQGWLKGLKMKNIDLKRQLLIAIHKNKMRTPLINEFLSFCDMLKKCGKMKNVCLKNPWSIPAILSLM